MIVDVLALLALTFGPGALVLLLAPALAPPVRPRCPTGKHRAAR
jgi:hypothetical protein